MFLFPSVTNPYSVCRREVYRCKLTTYFAVKSLAKTLENIATDGIDSAGTSYFDKHKSLKDLKTCLRVYKAILTTEWSSQPYPRPFDTNPESAALEESELMDEALHFRTCDFCECDVFNSFLVCSNLDCSSVRFYERNVDICAGCYCEGRSCLCGMMSICQLRDFKKLQEVENYAETTLNKLGMRAKRPENR
jgi:hypothetical protein